MARRWTQSYIATIAGTLSKTCIAESAGFRLEDVKCGCGRSSWSAPEEAGSYSIVFVRRGCFRRRAGDVEFLLDPATAYFERPGEVYRVAHPGDGGDACTQLMLPPGLIEDGPELELRYTRSDVDLAQRLLVRARADDQVEFVDRAVAIADMLLESPASRVAAVRAAAAATRRRVVEVDVSRRAYEPAAAGYVLPAPDPRLQAGHATVRDAIGRPGRTMLDVRSREEYQGERFWPSGALQPDGRPGHIPTAVHVPIDDLYDARGAFLPVPALRKVFAASGLDGDDVLAPNATELTDVRGDIEFCGVSFRYKEEHADVLRNISLHLRAGETVLTSGPTSHISARDKVPALP